VPGRSDIVLVGAPLITKLASATSPLLPPVTVTVKVPGGGAPAPLRIVATGIEIFPVKAGVIVQAGTAVNTCAILSGVRAVTVQVVSAVLKPEPVIVTVPPSLTAPGLTVIAGENGLTTKVAEATSPVGPLTVTTYWPLVAVVATEKLVADN